MLKVLHEIVKQHREAPFFFFDSVSERNRNQVSIFKPSQALPRIYKIVLLAIYQPASQGLSGSIDRITRSYGLLFINIRKSSIVVAN